MVLPVYPDKTLLKGLGFSTKWSPEFFNVPTESTASGADIDLALAQYPLHNFELTYNFLRDWRAPANASLEFRTLMGFWLMLGGTVGRFLFRNCDDNFAAAQLIGTGDGATTTFGPIVRTFGANGYWGSEPVGQIDSTQPVTVRLGDTVQASSSYTVNSSTPLNQTITFSAAPASGTPIYMDFGFFYYCKFAENSNTFEKFADRLWLLQKVALKSCRLGA